MPTIWGYLDRIDEGLQGVWWIQVRTVLPGGAAIRARALVGEKVLIARGIEQVNLSSLREGESVEVTYHGGRSGFMEADTIYVHPDQDSLTKQSKKDHASHTGGTYGSEAQGDKKEVQEEISHQKKEEKVVCD